MIQQGSGDMSVAARHLYTENYQVRRRNATLRLEVEEWNRRYPAGTIALTGDDALAFAELKKRGTVRQVLAVLKEGDDAKSKLVEVETTSRRGEAARTIGYNERVLADLCEFKKVEVEVREEVREGKKVKVPFVRKAGDPTAQWELLTAYAEREWADHLPALKKSGQSAQQNGQVNDNNPDPSLDPSSTNILQFPDNGAGTNGEPMSLVDQHIKQAAEAAAKRTNPLRAASGAK